MSFFFLECSRDYCTMFCCCPSDKSYHSLSDSQVHTVAFYLHFKKQLITKGLCINMISIRCKLHRWVIFYSSNSICCIKKKIIHSLPLWNTLLQIVIGLSSYTNCKNTPRWQHVWLFPCFFDSARGPTQVLFCLFWIWWPCLKMHSASV